MKVFSSPTASSKLVVVATPIGNVEELSARAIKALTDADLVFCEDTRVTGKLLRMLSLNKKMVSVGSVDERKDLPVLQKQMLKAQKPVLVSDAGYPGLSDPGVALIQSAYENDLAVEVINGPSALMHALAVSGFWINDFFYTGFLPAKTSDRRAKLQSLSKIASVIVCFEAPHRIVACLQDMAEVMSDRKIAVCRELTKLHETVYLGTAAELIGEVIDKGEFAIVIGPAIFSEGTFVGQETIEEAIERALARVNELVADGMRVKDACSLTGKEVKIKGSDLYSAYLKSKR